MYYLALTQGGTFAASYEIVKERTIFTRERAVNLSVWSYVLSKVVVLSLFALVQVAGVLLMLGLFVDLGVEEIVFIDFGILEIFISLYLAVLARIGLRLFISAMVPSTDVVLYIILAQLPADCTYRNIVPDAEQSCFVRHSRLLGNGRLVLHRGHPPTG